MSIPAISSNGFLPHSLARLLSVRERIDPHYLLLQSCVPSTNGSVFGTVLSAWERLGPEHPQVPRPQFKNDWGVLKVLHLKQVNYDYVELLRKLGPMHSLEHLVIELAVRTPELCPIGQPKSLPSWYSQGIESVIHWLVGKNSSLVSLTLRGFNAYARHDLLDKLLDPIYFPRLADLNLSGFSPRYGSEFWERIQRKDHEVGMLPLERITFFIKHCREDFTGEDLSDHALQGQGAFYPFIRDFMNYDRQIQCDVLFDSNVFLNRKPLSRMPNFKGYTWLVNCNENPIFRGFPQEFCHYRNLNWDTYSLAFLRPELDAPGWHPIDI